jgi:hypothetical protein
VLPLIEVARRMIDSCRQAGRRDTRVVGTRLVSANSNHSTHLNPTFFYSTRTF